MSVLAKLRLQGYEIFQSVGFSSSLTFSGGEIKSKERSAESGYGVRVLKNGKLGFSYCETENKIPETARRAAMLSRFSPKSGFSFAPKARYQKLKTQDRKLETMEANELRALLDQVRDGVEKHAKKARVIVSAGSERISLENSSGFSGSYASTNMTVYAEGMKQDGFGYAIEEGTHMPEDFTEIGKRAGKMAKEMVGAKKLKKGRYTIVFTLTTLDDLLGILLPSFSGDWKRRGTSTLAKKLGKKVFNQRLSIYDDGLCQASDARPFDDEGEVTKRRPLMEKGVVRNFIYDRETAALEGVKKSGFCNRAHFSAMPGAGSSNIVIGKGDYSDLMHELKDPLIVHSLHGSHTANTTTGDFGLEVNIAFHKEKPVRGFLLSGNIFKLLNGKIHIEREVKMHGSLIAPRLAFENVQVVS